MAKFIVNATTTTLAGTVTYIPTYEVRDIICSNGKAGLAITVFEANTTIQFQGPFLLSTVKTVIENATIVAKMHNSADITLIKFSDGKISHIHPIGRKGPIESDSEDEEELATCMAKP